MEENEVDKILSSAPTVNEIMRDLARSVNPYKPMQPDEFTSAMFAEVNDLPYTSAKYQLRKAIDAGLITRRKIAGRQYAYRMANGHEVDTCAE